MKFMTNDVFLVTAFNFVVRNWHLDLKDHQIDHILKEVKGFIANRPESIKYKRVYIEKDGGR